ncbi:MAG: oligopeptide transporter, OPT family, partial [Bryocella sp.]
GIELLGIRSLTFAVGAYLSIGTTLAIFCGGVVRWLVDRAAEKSGNSALSEVEKEVSSGSLLASGLIAAGGIVGLAGVGLKLLESVTSWKTPHFSNTPLYKDWVSVLAFGALMFSLYYFARKPIPSEVILEAVEEKEI